MLTRGLLGLVHQRSNEHDLICLYLEEGALPRNFQLQAFLFRGIFFIFTHGLPCHDMGYHGRGSMGGVPESKQMDPHNPSGETC
jgi:hypothetical protein